MIKGKFISRFFGPALAGQVKKWSVVNQNCDAIFLPFHKFF